MSNRTTRIVSLRDSLKNCAKIYLDSRVRNAPDLRLRFSNVITVRRMIADLKRPNA